MPLRDTNGKRIVLWLIVGLVLLSFVGLDFLLPCGPERTNKEDCLSQQPSFPAGAVPW